MHHLLLSLTLLIAVNSGLAQEQWPRVIEAKEAKITMYQPQPEALSGDKLTARSAVSVTPKSGDPVFGAIWLDSRVATDRTTRIVTLVNVKVTAVKFPQAVDSVTMKKFKTLLETEIIKWDLQISLDDLLATLEVTDKEKNIDANLKHDAPEIIISPQPALLVLIDGEPKFEKLEDTSLQRVMNSPYFIVKDKSEKYYLNADDKWYSTASITGEWKVTTSPPKEVKKQEEKFSKDQPPASGVEQATGKKVKDPQILVRTAPAELIITDGESSFTPIQGTQLLYVKNTESHLFMNIQTQEYFTLISGRWYIAKNLKGPWTYTASDKLPEDFAKIPEGSEKDIVLANVAGTPAAKEAVLDAQIPQTAAVDRKTATVTVKYDGDPKFEKIEGTSLAYAMNTASSVILSEKTYYVCDNAVWFTGQTPTGPWTVATEIPKDVQKIPPSSPVYNVKYVYIYESTPEVVYVGYTPGYVGCYVYGPTIVYGTGYYYNPWYGPFYYPRPVTYGMAMYYNPYMGWSMGVSIHVGGPYYGGWYGPPMYRPPYYAHHHHYYGGGGNTVIINNGNRNNINGGNNNIYNNHKDGVRPSTGQGNAARPSTRPANGQNNNAARPSTNPAGTRNNNNVMTDRNGDVYQKQGDNWQQNNGKSWENAQQNNRDLDRQQTNRDRGTQRSNNASQMNRSGGGARMGGGGGGMRRR